MVDIAINTKQVVVKHLPFMNIILDNKRLKYPPSYEDP